MFLSQKIFTQIFQSRLIQVDFVLKQVRSYSRNIKTNKQKILSQASNAEAKEQPNKKQTATISSDKQEKNSAKQINIANKQQDKQNSQPQQNINLDLNQNYILKANTLKDLFDIYQNYHQSFNIVNYCSVFHRCFRFAPKSEWNKYDYKALWQYQEFKDLFNYLKNNIEKMNSFAISNFISNLVRLNYFDEVIITKIQQQIENNKVDLNPTSASFILWSLAKQKTNNQILVKMCTKKLKETKQSFGVKNLANIFYSLSQLKCNDDALINKIEKEIIEKSQQFDSTCINLVFSVYNNQFKPNYDVLDALSSRFIKLINEHSFRNIANLCTYCSNLNYVNHLLLDTIESEILRRVQPGILKETDVNEDFEEEYKEDEPTQETKEKEDSSLFLKNNEQVNKKSQIKGASPQAQSLHTSKENSVPLVDQKKNVQQQQSNQQNEKQDNLTQILKEANASENKNKGIITQVKESKYIDDLNPQDTSQILLALCKLKIVKQRLFEILEYNFIKKIKEATPKSICSYAFAHSSLCTEMMMKFYEKKHKYLKRSIKNIKKYNNSFYEMVIPFVSTRLNEFSLEQLQSLFTSASRPLAKKRVICRQVIQIGLDSLPKFKTLESKYSKDELNKIIYEYVRILQNFAYQDSQKIKLLEGLKQNNIDIDTLITKYGYLTPKQKIDVLEDKIFDDDSEDDVDAKDEKNKNKQDKKQQETDTNIYKNQEQQQQQQNIKKQEQDTTKPQNNDQPKGL